MIDEYLNEASKLRNARKFDEAKSMCERASALDDGDFRPHFLSGLIQIDKSEHRTALECFKKATQLEPNDPSLLVHYGTSLREFGRFEKAIEQFEKAIAAAPDFPQAYMSLVTTKKMQQGDPIIDDLVKLKDAHFDSQFDKSLIHFALGKVFDDLEDFDAAFENYALANDLQGKVYEHQPTLQVFDRLKSIFTKELFDSLTGRGNRSNKPIFIIGMPRSGSSLVEELLCRNDKIFGLGERTEIAQIVSRLEKTHPSHKPYPDIIADITGDQYSQLGDLYLMLLKDRAESADRIVDKNILNHSLAGFIRLTFSNATIVHTQRDPIDTCLSCYFQNFHSGLEFCYDLNDLGKRYAAYADLMEHWQNVMGDGLHTIIYEKLVESPQVEANKLFERVDMALPSDLDTPSDRGINTASAWQARQPIYQHSTGRWKNYERHLGPLFNALEKAGMQYSGS